MIKSLQEQLISSGLIDKKRAKMIQTEQQKSNRKERRSGLPQDSQLAFQKASKECAERDKALNRQRQLLSEQKAVAAQISQLVQAIRLPKEVDGDTVLAAIRARLSGEFGIGHATVQIEREGC